MDESPRINGRIDLDRPRWNQDSFFGRLKHFASITDYTTISLFRTKDLYAAKELLEKYRLGQEPASTTDAQIHYAKKLYGSAFHPDTGELQNVIGRMSFQVPGGMIITAAMLHFYKTVPGVVITQWFNQSFNALVNYTNRNAASALSTKQMAVAYTSATTCALVTALGMKRALASSRSPLLQRFVPFMAVCAANFVNIPFTRQDEVLHGVVLLDEDNTSITRSKTAATKGISQVAISRVTIAAPGMLMLPVIMERMEKRPRFKARPPWFHLTFQTFMLGVFLTVMVPIGCSLFPQRSSISVERLRKSEPECYQDIVKHYGEENLPETLYFNKGL